MNWTRLFQKNANGGPPPQNDQTTDFAQRVAQPRPHPKFFWGVTIGWLALMSILAVATAVSGQKIILTESITLPAWQLVLGLVLVWAATSVKKLEADELGAVLFWGKTMLPVRRGPKFLITGIFQLERFKAAVFQNQFPDEPEFIQKTDDKTPLEPVEITLPDGTKYTRSKVRPIRITTAKPAPTLGKDDILNVQMVVEFTFWVRWIIVDPFLFIVNAEGSVASVVKQMRDTGETALGKQVTKLTPSELIDKFDELLTNMENAVREKVAPWGVSVVGLGMTAPDLNHEVASALRDIPKEKAIAVQTKTKADAEAYRLEKEGEGLGKKRELELAGEGRGYKQMSEILGIDGREALAAQVARDTIGQSDLVLGAEGIAQALGLGKAVLDRANKRKDEK